MSKIKKALERLKSESQLKEIKEEKAERKEAISEKLEKIVYTKTKVIHVDPEKLKENKIVAIDEEDPLTDQFKVLRTRILNRTRAEGKKTIQVSGFGIDEGKSIIASNLAIAMAKETRQTTLLVDLDLRNPSIHKLFCLGDVKGLKDYFEKGVPLEELFINPGIPKFTILPAGGKIIGAPEILGSPKMETMVKELRERYPDRYIIFDTPGMNICPDPLIVSEYMDAILLVARVGVTDQDAIKSVMKIVPKEKLLGIVLNDFIWADEIMSYYKYRYKYYL
ncbi:MAG: exopolysaccharide biosynthesis protein [Deltaproteobacteria bacterium]|nr:MAG: exopolysaccharide biosynthesis protein [Deltaproteobacteria bacterium]